MSENTIKVRLRNAYKTESQWSSQNPILLSGEVCYSSDKPGWFKVGNGSTNWASLPYNQIAWTSVSGRPAALKNPNSLTVQFNGATNKIYDGSTAQTVNITPASIGAVALTGGSISGQLSFSNGKSIIDGTVTTQLSGQMGVSDYWRIGVGATASDSGFVEFASGDNGNEPIYIRQYSGAFQSLKRSATLLDSSGNTSFPGVMTVGSLSSGSVSIKGVLNLNRKSNINYGRISWYDPSYYTWYDYMSDISAGRCPTGGTPSTKGNVTSWAKRSLVENQSGYGWIWESCANGSGNNPTAIMALSSNNGNLYLKGTLQTDGGITSSGRISANGAITIPTVGNSWVHGMTTISTSGGILATGNSASNYHPIIRYQMNSGNQANLGAITDRFGFWGYKAGRTENSTDCCAYLDVANNRFVATKFYGPLQGNADTATKAAQDGNGNVITNKYVTLDTTQSITGQKTFTGISSFSNTTESVSPSTGAAVVYGGLGVAKQIVSNGKLFVGQNTAANAVIYLNNKIAIRGIDGWLRLNDSNSFTSGIYCGTALLRTDGTFQVGSAGATVNVTSSAIQLKKATTISATTAITNTTASTSIQTGALKVSGGVGVSGQVSSVSMQIADKVKLEYNSATESLDFIFV